MVFVSTFLSGVTIRDAYQERWLKKNVKLIHPGMTDQEVIAILGRPTSRHMSDIPGDYWCWGSDSFSDNPDYCGKVTLQMGPTGIVEKVLPIIP